MKGSKFTSYSKTFSSIVQPKGRDKEWEEMCIDSPVKHAFTFTPAISIFVDCESEAELDAAITQLSSGGEVLMPLGDYGFSKKFGWINDRFGVSWQLNLE